MITRTFKLCLNAGTGSAPFINVSQTDKDEVWLFELYTETGERYIPSSGAIIGIKADGHGIANTGTVDSEGRVVITETEQMTAAAGRSIFELSIDGLTHGTANFIVNVEKKPIDGAIMSDSDLSLISEAIDSAAVIVDVIGDGDPSEVIGEHVDAWLDAHPEATTTVEDGAITAPKINNSLWDKLLVSEEASGAVASFDDGADDVPVSSLKVALEPIQLGSGDPSPSNIRPIVAANGKNLLNIPNMDTTFGALTVKSNNGVCVANGTATSSTTCTLLRMTGTLPAGEYILNGNANFTQQIVLQVYSYTRSSNIARCLSNADVTFTVNANEDIVVVLYVFSGQTLNNFTFYPMIRPASITDSTFQPYQGIMVERKGKNLLKNTATSKTENGITFTVNADGTVTGNGTSTALVNLTVGRVYVTVGETYILKATSGGSLSTYKMRAVVRNANGGAIDIGGGPFQDAYNGVDKSITMPSSASYMEVYCNVENGQTITNALYEPMVRLASVTDSTYEPYTGTSYPYTLGREVYGGTVDLATGVLTVDREIVDMTAYASQWTIDTANERAYAFINNAKAPVSQPASIVCNRFKTIDYSQIFAKTAYGVGLSPGLALQFRIQGVTDISSATRTSVAEYFAANPTQVVYELATPQTIQLTPTEVKTLLGYNNISSTGTVDVIYHADTKLYVDKMTAVDNNIIAPTEQTFTATRNYTVNDLVIVNDTLYKVTANIANGGTITPNSNVTATTLSALIKALS